jgi:hypothetical protein
LDEAEALIKGNLTASLQSLTMNSLHKCLIRATLGNFYKSTDRPSLAIPILSEVIEEIGEFFAFAFESTFSYYF